MPKGLALALAFIALPAAAQTTTTVTQQPATPPPPPPSTTTVTTQSQPQPPPSTTTVVVNPNDPGYVPPPTTTTVRTDDDVGVYTAPTGRSAVAILAGAGYGIYEAATQPPPRRSYADHDPGDSNVNGFAFPAASGRF